MAGKHLIIIGRRMYKVVSPAAASCEAAVSADDRTRVSTIFLYRVPRRYWGLSSLHSDDFHA